MASFNRINPADAGGHFGAGESAQLNRSDISRSSTSREISNSGGIENLGNLRMLPRRNRLLLGHLHKSTAVLSFLLATGLLIDIPDFETAPSGPRVVLRIGPAKLNWKSF